jgi:hypothetical protein
VWTCAGRVGLEASLDQLKEGFNTAVEAMGEAEALDPLDEFLRKFDGDAHDVPSGLRSHNRIPRVRL